MPTTDRQVVALSLAEQASLAGERDAAKLARAARLFLEGLPPAVVSERLGVNRRTASRWKLAFKRDGILK